MAEGFLLVGLQFNINQEGDVLLIGEMIYPLAVLERTRLVYINCRTFLINVSIRVYILRTTFLVYRSI